VPKQSLYSSSHTSENSNFEHALPPPAPQLKSEIRIVEKVISSPSGKNKEEGSSKMGDSQSRQNNNTNEASPPLVSTTTIPDLSIKSSNPKTTITDDDIRVISTLFPNDSFNFTLSSDRSILVIRTVSALSSSVPNVVVNQPQPQPQPQPQLQQQQLTSQPPNSVFNSNQKTIETRRVVKKGNKVTMHVNYNENESEENEREVVEEYEHDENKSKEIRKEEEEEEDSMFVETDVVEEGDEKEEEES
jgi:hypothetical protein